MRKTLKNFVRKTKLLCYILPLFIMASCSNSGNSGSGPVVGGNKSVLKMLLTDFPLQNKEVSKVLVKFESVEVHSEKEGWLTLADYGEEGRSFDLLTLQNGVTEALGAFVLDAGLYTQIRLTLKAENQIEVDEGKGPEMKPLTTPSAQKTGVKLIHSFEVVGEGVTVITLDFDAQKSIVSAGGKYLLKPVIKVVESSTTSGIEITSPPDNYQTQLPAVPVKGFVHKLISGEVPSVQAEFGGRTFSVDVNADGTFGFDLAIPAESTVSGNVLTITARDVSGKTFSASKKIVFVPEFVQNQVLIRFHPSATEAEAVGVINSLRGKVSDALRAIKLYQIDLPAGSNVKSVVNSLTGNSLVAYALPNYYATPTLVPNDTNFTQMWGMNNTGQTGGTSDADIDAVEAWDINTGSRNVIVAVLDDGIDITHPDLAANVFVNTNEAPGDANADGCPGICGVDDDGDGLRDFEDPEVRNIFNNGVDDDHDGVVDEQSGDFDGAIYDDDENGYPDDFNGWDFRDNDNNPAHDASGGHGTHVAGTIGALGNNGLGVTGVNWRVSILPLRVFGSSDMATDPIIVMRAVRAFAYAASMGASVTNNSWRGIYGNKTAGEIDAMNNLMKDVNNLSLLHVMAAGNENQNLGNLRTNCAGLGYSTCFYFPTHTDIPNKIVVAATDHNDARASFSNFGNEVDVAAPGVNILSTVRGGGYQAWNGTSMASPHVTGLAALTLAQLPDLMNQGILLREHLRSTVDVISGLSGIVNTSGRINAFRALSTPASLPTFINGTQNIPSAFAVNTSHLINCDVDNDGDDDMIIPVGFTGFIESAKSLLLINNGGVFTNETELRMNIGTHNLIGGDCGDVDGDGDNDLILSSFTPPTTSDRQNILLINNGAGYFTDETASRLPAILDISRDADFVDIDGDSDLDIYVSNATPFSIPNKLLLNDGSGHFTDVSAARLPAGENGDSHNAEIADVDGDGDMDIYVCNQVSFGGTGIDQLLINDGSGFFTDQAASRGIIVVDASSHEARFADVNGDGTLDLVIARRDNQNNLMYMNDGTGRFTEESASRFPALLFSTSALDVGDVDNDGDIDILFGNGDPNVFVTQQNHLLINNGSGYFSEMGGSYGIPQGVVDTTKTILLFDPDRDGDLDIWTGNFGEYDALLLNTTIP